MCVCVLDLSIQTIGPEDSDAESTALSANGNTMQINLEGLAKNNNGKGEKNSIRKTK